MSRAYSVPWNVPDLDIHPDPPEGWHRCAVASMWTPVAQVRKRWPYVAVVGPLRTVRGIDLLIRGILANPAVRILIIDGQDSTEGETVQAELRRLWQPHYRGALGADICTDFALMREHVMLAGRANTSWRRNLCPGEVHGDYAGPAEDRPGGAIILPPPPLDTTAEASYSDPGENRTRIAMDTLEHLDAAEPTLIAAAAEVLIEGARVGKGVFNPVTIPPYADKIRRIRDCWTMIGSVLRRRMGEDAFLDFAKELLIAHAKDS